MSEDKNEDKRLELTQKIVSLDQKEEDFVNLKNQHVERIADFGAVFNQLSIEIDYLLSGSSQLDHHTL